MIPIFPDTGVHEPHFHRWQYGSIVFKFSWWVPKNTLLCNRVRTVRWRSSKVVDFGTNRKRVCNFLLVINSNLGPILPRFRDIAGFLRKTATFHIVPSLHLKCRDVPLGLDRRCWGFELRRLIICVITFQVTQRTVYDHKSWTSRTDRQRTVHRAVKSDDLIFWLSFIQHKLLLFPLYHFLE